MFTLSSYQLFRRENADIIVEAHKATWSSNHLFKFALRGYFADKHHVTYAERKAIMNRKNKQLEDYMNRYINELMYEGK